MRIVVKSSVINNVTADVTDNVVGKLVRFRKGSKGNLFRFVFVPQFRHQLRGYLAFLAPPTLEAYIPFGAPVAVIGVDAVRGATLVACYQYRVGLIFVLINNSKC